jgi:carboxymethylenebutenolidase
MQQTAPPWQNDPQSTMQVTSRDGTFDVYIARPATRSGPVVVVLHEIFGVNADMRTTCQELANAGFIALCPELFWRQERGVDLSNWSKADWKKGFGLYVAHDLDASVSDVESTVAAARAIEGASGRVGVMGYCLGGLLTFLTAARTQVDVAVAYHGGRTEEFLDEAADIDAPLLMHLAAEDEYISKSVQQRIHEMLDPRSHVEVHDYPGSRHGFSRHGGTHYDATAATLATARTLAFLRRHLQ